jgi:hypothetical protein
MWRPPPLSGSTRLPRPLARARACVCARGGACVCTRARAILRTMEHVSDNMLITSIMLNDMRNDINGLGFCVVFMCADGGRVCAHCMALAAPPGQHSPARDRGPGRTAHAARPARDRGPGRTAHAARPAQPGQHETQGRACNFPGRARPRAAREGRPMIRPMIPLLSAGSGLVHIVVYMFFVVAKQLGSLKAGPIALPLRPLDTSCFITRLRTMNFV